MNYNGMLIKMVTFAVLLSASYIFSRRGILTESFSKSAGWLILNLFIPASILNSVIGERPELTGAELGNALLTMTITLIVMYAVSTAAGMLMARARRGKSDGGGVPDGDETVPQDIILMAVVNNLFVGLPVVQTLCSGEAPFYMGVSCVPYNIILYTYGAYLLNRGKGKSGFSLKSLLSVPLVSALLALVIFVFNIRVPGAVKDVIGTASSATVAVTMLVTGANLGSMSLISAFTDRHVLIISAVRLLLTPVICWLAVKHLAWSRILLATCIVMAACPCGTVCTPLTIRYGYDVPRTSRTVMVTTALSIVTIPLIVFLFF